MADETPFHLMPHLKERRALFIVVHPYHGLQGTLKAVEASVEAGADGVFLINQGASVEETLTYGWVVRERYPGLWMGVNLLGLDPPEAIRVAGACRTADDRDEVFNGLWVDDCGAGLSRDGRVALAEANMDADMEACPGGWITNIFGGVAFKGQAHVPDAELGAHVRAAYEWDGLCHVVTTSGPRTGVPPSMERIRLMHEALPPYGHLAIASGITAENVAPFLPYASAFLVGTGVEWELGRIDSERARQLARIIHAYKIPPETPR